MKKLWLVLIVAVIVVANCDDECPVIHRFADQTNYNITPDITTPDGMDLDTSGLPIDPDLIDRVTREVEDCLIKNFGDPPVIPPEVRQATFCPYNTFDLPIDRECLTVKIPNDCFLSNDGTQELLPAVAPDYVCEDKGIILEEGQKCHWRAGIQDYWTIVSCPSLYLYKDPLVRLTTGCVNPWAHPLLSECARPSTEALSGLVTD